MLYNNDIQTFKSSSSKCAKSISDHKHPYDKTCHFITAHWCAPEDTIISERVPKYPRDTGRTCESSVCTEKEDFEGKAGERLL